MKKPRYDRIGGWLIIPAIGLAFGSIGSIAFLIMDMVLNGRAVMFSVMNTPIGLLFFLFNLGFVALIVWTTFIFFRKNYLAPILMVILLSLKVGEEFLNRWLSSGEVGKPWHALTYAAVFIPYFLRSKRVKETFVQGRRKVDPEVRNRPKISAKRKEKANKRPKIAPKSKEKESTMNAAGRIRLFTKRICILLSVLSLGFVIAGFLFLFDGEDSSDVAFLFVCGPLAVALIWTVYHVFWWLIAPLLPAEDEGGKASMTDGSPAYGNCMNSESTQPTLKNDGRIEITIDDVY